MNVQQYVGYFDELADVDPSTQAEILERARYHAFVVLDLSAIYTRHLVLCFLMIFLIAVLPVLLLHTPAFYLALSAGIGIVVGWYYLKRSNAALIRKGLIAVLAESEISSNDNDDH